MVRTLLSDHGRIAVGALVGAIAAALFAEGLISGPEQGSPGDGLIISKNGGRNPQPVPAMPGVGSVSQGVPTPSAAPPTTPTTSPGTTPPTTQKSSTPTAH